MTCPGYPLVSLDYARLFLHHIFAYYSAIFKKTNLFAKRQIEGPSDASTATMQTEQMPIFSYLESMMLALNLDSYSRCFRRLSAVSFGKRSSR